MSKVAIISYNAGNTLSVQAALRRLEVDTIVTDDKNLIKQATHIIFPGVGHCAPAAEYLRKFDLDLVLKEARQPVLGICLGMQLMCEHSEEGNTPGLGIFKAKCRAFVPGGFKVPHMGWNSISKQKGKLFEQSSEKSYLYFVHSYRVDVCEDTSAVCEYGEKFSAALERDNFFGVQFHPEKSSLEGQAILKKFLTI